MIGEDQFERVIALLPVLQQSEPALVEEIRRHAHLARLEVGDDIFVAGETVDSVPLLLSGMVRVYQIGESGREVTLYRFRPGESCVLTANAVLGEQNFPAIATVEESAEAVMIPATAFRAWMDRFDSWRDFVFEMASQRLASVMAIVDDVAFRRLDQRVAALLHGRGQSENPIRITHQEIAAELGSSREVITRVVERLVADRLIRSSRGKIEIIDLEALHSKSQM